MNLGEQMDALLARHQRVALQFSGGKDSMAVLYLLRPWLERITVYHLRTGDQLLATDLAVESCRKWIPNFRLIESNSVAWRALHGWPSDLVPTFSTWMGRSMGHSQVAISDRFQCCASNVMLPMAVRMGADKMTLLIRGTKAYDLPMLPARSGAKDLDFEIFLPIEDWTDAEVFRFLHKVEAPYLPIYNYCSTNTDCKTCTAYLEEEHWRYLQKDEPEAAEVIRKRLLVMEEEIDRQLGPLRKAFYHDQS